MERVKDTFFSILPFKLWYQGDYAWWTTLKKVVLLGSGNIFFFLAVATYTTALEGFLPKTLLLIMLCGRIYVLVIKKEALAKQLKRDNRKLLMGLSMLNWGILVICSVSKKIEMMRWLLKIMIMNDFPVALLIVANLLMVDCISSPEVVQEIQVLRHRQFYWNELQLTTQAYTHNETQILKKVHERLLTEHFERKSDVIDVGVDGTRIEHKLIFDKKSLKKALQDLSLQKRVDRMNKYSEAMVSQNGFKLSDGLESEAYLMNVTSSEWHRGDSQSSSSNFAIGSLRHPSESGYPFKGSAYMRVSSSKPKQGSFLFMNVPTRRMEDLVFENPVPFRNINKKIQDLKDIYDRPHTAGSKRNRTMKEFDITRPAQRSQKGIMSIDFNEPTRGKSASMQNTAPKFPKIISEREIEESDTRNFPKLRFKSRSKRVHSSQATLRYVSLFPNCQRYKRYLRNKLTLTQNYLMSIKMGIFKSIEETCETKNNFYNLLRVYLNKNRTFAESRQVDLVRLIRGDYDQIKVILNNVQGKSEQYSQNGYYSFVCEKIKQAQKNYLDSKQKIRSRRNTNKFKDIWEQVSHYK